MWNVWEIFRLGMKFVIHACSIINFVLEIVAWIFYLMLSGYIDQLNV
jgi:hypothetical protein